MWVRICRTGGNAQSVSLENQPSQTVTKCLHKAALCKWMRLLHKNKEEAQDAESESDWD